MFHKGCSIGIPTDPFRNTGLAGYIQAVPAVIRVHLNNFHTVRGSVLTDHIQLIVRGILLMLGGHAHVHGGPGGKRRVRGRRDVFSIRMPPTSSGIENPKCCSAPQEPPFDKWQSDALFATSLAKNNCGILRTALVTARRRVICDCAHIDPTMPESKFGKPFGGNTQDDGDRFHILALMVKVVRGLAFAAV